MANDALSVLTHVDESVRHGVDAWRHSVQFALHEPRGVLFENGVVAVAPEL